MITNSTSRKKLALAIAASSAIAGHTNMVSAQEDSSFKGLEEVIVTAQRREESLQDAAIAIEAIDTERLTRSTIESGRDLGRLSPSIGTLAGGGVSTSIFVRGVGALTVNPLQDSGVAQNYDGVFLGRASGAASQTFFDMERVEVLKGPQGTLYGRNTTGGVLNYIPQKPILGEASGYVQADLGSFSKKGFQGAYNIPISDQVAARIAANTLKRDGYSDDGHNDADHTSFRGQILFEPSDALSIRLAADYTEVGGIGTGGSVTGFFRDGIFTPTDVDVDAGPTSASSNAIRGQFFAAPAFTPLEPITIDGIGRDSSFTGFHADINYEFEKGSLTIIPAYREADIDDVSVGPGFLKSQLSQDPEQVSLEVRFATDFDGPVNAIIGAFYFDEEVDFAANFNQQAVAPVQSWTNGGDSAALFAQVNVDLSERARLNLGARYTADDKFVRGQDGLLLQVCNLPEVEPFPGAGFTIPDFAGCGALGLPGFSGSNDPQEIINQSIADGLIDPGSEFELGAFYGISSLFDPTLTPPFQAFIVDAGAGQGETREKFNEPTYRVGLEFDVADDSMVYINYERGFRAGGVDIDPTRLVFDEEFVNALTIGSKNRFFDNRLQLNAELFSWDYEDQQVTFFSVNLDNSPRFATNNGNSTVRGLDLDLIWAITDDTRLSVKYQYLDSVFDDLILDTAPQDTGRFGCTDTQTIGANGLNQYDCSGKSLIFSPEQALDVSLSHTFRFIDGFMLSGNVDVQYRSDQANSYAFRDETNMKSHTLVDAQIVLMPDSETWSLSLYGTNLGDERRIQFPNTSATGLTYNIYNPPTMYGVRLRVDL
jgi:iron complex outermembrane receptor protein